MTKNNPSPTPAPQVTTSSSISIPLIAMILGVVSLVTFMWFLGIPAIVLGIIGLKKYKENHGYSITGLVTGIISTLLLVGAIIFFSFILLFAILNSDTDSSVPQGDDGYHRYHDDSDTSEDSFRMQEGV